MENLKNRRTRLASTPILGGVLLFTALAASRGYAQFVPVSPNLSPELTANPDSEPVTTLAIDLLAPQRAYIVDPTGASLSANSLNPSIYTSSLSASTAVTDTQLRDSSQTGHFSPYAASGERLGVNSSGDEGAGSEDNRGSSNGLFRGPLSGPGGNSSSGNSTSAIPSSWGTSSSFGEQSNAGSSGTARLSVNGMGRRQAEESSTGGTDSEGYRTTANNSNGPAMGNSEGYSANRGARSSSRYSNGKPDGDAVFRYGGSASNSSARGTMGHSSRGASSQDQPQDQSGEIPARSGTSRGMGGSTGGASGSTANTALSFFPQATYSQSPLGETPFSSPGGAEELHFLNPNILAATSQGGSLSSGGRGSAKESGMRENSVRRRSPTTAASHTGLNAHPASGNLPPSMSEASGLARRSHLSTGLDPQE